MQPSRRRALAAAGWRRLCLPRAGFGGATLGRYPNARGCQGVRDHGEIVRKPVYREVPVLLEIAAHGFADTIDGASAVA